MSDKHIALSLITLSLAFLTSCGALQSLRKDVDDGDSSSSSAITSGPDFDYRGPMNRNTPPPPANVDDTRASMLSGSPVDLSGTRAKATRMTAKDFNTDNVKNENSLWAEDGQNNYLFAQNKLKNPGDLVSVVIEDQLRKDMIDSVKKLIPPEYRDQDIVVPGLTKDVPDPAATTDPARAPAATSSTEPGPNDILTAEVLERYANGNLRLRGVKRVPFKRQVRYIEVLAIVKGSEVSENDNVKSSKFFEQRVELYK